MRVGANCPGISWISQLLFNQRAQSATVPSKKIFAVHREGWREDFSRDLPSKNREEKRDEKVRRIKTRHVRKIRQVRRKNVGEDRMLEHDSSVFSNEGRIPRRWHPGSTLRDDDDGPSRPVSLME